MLHAFRNMSTSPEFLSCCYGNLWMEGNHWDQHFLNELEESTQLVTTHGVQTLSQWCRKKRGFLLFGNLMVQQQLKSRIQRIVTQLLEMYCLFSIQILSSFITIIVRDCSANTSINKRFVMSKYYVKNLTFGMGNRN